MNAVKKLEQLRKENQDILFTVDKFGGFYGLFVYANYKGINLPIASYCDDFNDHVEQYKNACESFLNKDKNYLIIEEELENGYNKQYTRWSYKYFLQTIIIYNKNSKFDGLISFADAAKKWDIAGSTLRMAVADGRLKEGKDVQKFGRDWVVTEEAMKRLYGEPEE